VHIYLISRHQIGDISDYRGLLCANRPNTKPMYILASQ